MLQKIKEIIKDDSGQVMVEYAIITTSTALIIFAFLNREILSTFPDGIYKSVYYLVRGLMICAVLPFG